MGGQRRHRNTRMPSREITELKDAIRATHGCESLHVESVPVKVAFEDKTAWEGTVEVFDLIGHLQAKRAYAWSYRDGNQNKTMAVLETPGFSPYTNAQICCFKCANLFLHENHRFPYRPILTLVMIVAAGFFVAGVGCSLALIIRELRKAPEGYEDEHGFYTVRKGAVKCGVPDSTKARRTRSSPNWAMHRTPAH